MKQELLKAGADVSKVDSEKRSPWRLAIAAGHDTVALMLREQWQRVIGTQQEAAAVAALSEKDRDRALHAAVNDDVPTIEELMAIGLPATFADDHGTSLLMVAAAGGSMRVLAFLISRGVAVTTPNMDGKTALHFAADHPDAFAALVAAGGELAAQDRDGRTPVHETAAQGWVDEAAIKAQAFDVASTDLAGRTPLHDAAAHVHLEVIKKLLELGAPISRPDKEGAMPLHLAAAHALGSEAVKLLMQRGAVPSARDARNVTPLRLSITKARNVDSMCQLLEAGANVEAADADGVTPLRAAVDIGGLDFVVPLCNGYRANPNVRDKHNNSPLWSAIKQRRADIVRQLLAAKPVPASANETYSDRTNAMTTACAGGDPQCVKALVDTTEMTAYFVEIATDEAGNTPIIAAIKGGRGGALDMLTGLGAALPPFPLHLAAAAPRSGALRWLLGRPGADVNEKNPKGYAPLHVAAESNRVGCLRALLEAGADETLLSKEGEDASTIAEAMDNKEAYEFFKAKAAIAALPDPTPEEEGPDVTPRPEEAAAAERARAAAEAAAKAKPTADAAASGTPAVGADDLLAALAGL